MFVKHLEQLITLSRLSKWKLLGVNNAHYVPLDILTSFDTQITLWGNYYYPHYIDENTEAQALLGKC